MTGFPVSSYLRYRRSRLPPRSSITLKFLMYPSSLRMRASSTLKRDDGMSAFSCRAESAFLRRARRSETGSLMFIVPPSPRRLRHPGHVAGEREVPEADATQAELPQERPRTAAAHAAVSLADRKFQFRIRLDDGGATSHACAP